MHACLQPYLSNPSMHFLMHDDRPLNHICIVPFPPSAVDPAQVLVAGNHAAIGMADSCDRQVLPKTGPNAASWDLRRLLDVRLRTRRSRPVG